MTTETLNRLYLDLSDFEDNCKKETPQLTFDVENAIHIVLNEILERRT